MASEACERCGALAPLAGSAAGRLCRECRARSPAAVGSGPIDLRGLLAGVVALFPRVWLPATLATFAFALAAVPLRAGLGGGLAAALAADAWMLLATAARIDLAAQAVPGHREPAWRPALLRALRCWPRLVATRALWLAAVAVGLLALVVPGVRLALSGALVTPLVVRGEAAGLAAYRISRERMAGRRRAAAAAFGVVWLASAVLLVATALLAAAAMGGIADPGALAAAGPLAAVAFLLVHLVALPGDLLLVVLDARTRAGEDEPSGSDGPYTASR